MAGNRPILEVLNDVAVDTVAAAITLIALAAIAAPFAIAIGIALPFVG